MRAGRLDRLVTIEVNTPSRDGTGEEVDSWGTFASIWAGRMDIRGREFFDQAQIIGEGQAVWRIRWLDGIRTQMRLVDGSDTWNIESIAEVGGRREAMELSCTRLGV